MTAGELIEKLKQFPSDMEVITKKIEVFGNVGYIFSVYEGSYGFFGKDIPCVIISDESEDNTNV